MTGRQRALPIQLGAIALGVVVQATFAGMFLSGESTRTPHTTLGALLPFLALVPAVTAAARRRRLPPSVWVGAVGLPVLLWVQMVLGHLPWAGATVAHVPLGVLLFGGSFWLAGAAARASA